MFEFADDEKYIKSHSHATKKIFLKHVLKKILAKKTIWAPRIWDPSWVQDSDASGAEEGCHLKRESSF